jgi:hypothetical protein
MNIAKIDYSPKTESLDIYITGCLKEPHCKGCHNPELWAFDKGGLFGDFTKASIKDYLRLFPTMIKRILIMGGEPLHQNMEELKEFLFFIRESIIPQTKVSRIPSQLPSVFLFTGLSLEEFNSVCEEHPFISDYIDYVKVGPYNSDLKVEKGDNKHFGIELASSNQFILKVD